VAFCWGGTACPGAQQVVWPAEEVAPPPLPSFLSSSRPCGPQAGDDGYKLTQYVYCSIGHGTEASVTSNALLGLALWVFSTFRHGLPQWMEKVRCARNLNIGNFRCAEVRNFGYYRTCISSCLRVTFLFLVIRFW
jgi:hypothetical protein